MQPPAKALTVAQSKALSSPQTPKPTTQAVKSLTEKEYYAQQGKIILGKLQTEIQRIEVKVASARAKYNRTGTDSASEKLEKVEEQRDALKSLTTKAATGKYTYDSLANYAYDYANYRLRKAKEVRAKLVEQKVVIEDIPPKTIVIKPEETTAATPEAGVGLYAPLESITGYTGGTATAYTAPTGGTPVYIKPTVKHTGYVSLINKPEPTGKTYTYIPLEDVGPVTPGKQPLKVDTLKMDIATNYGQGTSIFNIPTFEMPTQTKQYIAQQKLKDRISELKEKDEWEKGSIFTYDYGQSTPIAKPYSFTPSDINLNKIEYSKPGDIITTPESNILNYNYGQDTPMSSIIQTTKEFSGIEYYKPNQIKETPTLTFIGDKTATEKKKLEDQLGMSIKIGSPTLEQVQASADQRGSLSTLSYIGEEPKISGKELTYATGKILQENIQKELQQDYEIAYAKKQKEIESKIDTSSFQDRVDAGENINIVQAEIDKEYATANKELEKFTKIYQKDWATNEGAALTKTSSKLYFDTQFYGKAKDTESILGGLFVTGAAIGTGTAVASSAIVATMPSTAPVLFAGGLVVGGAITGIAFGKSVIAGKTTYAGALEAGFTKEEALPRGLFGAAVDIAPFTATAAGATVGGFLTGYAIKYVRTPITTKYKVSLNKITVKSSGITSIKSQKLIGGKMRQVISYPKQKFGETPVPGSRAETTTRWRSFFNTKLDTTFKPVATGYPSDTAGRARAIKLYREYGLSTSQAKDVIKFIKPLVIEQYITSGYAYKGDNKLVSGTIFTRESSMSMVVDKKLGVETGYRPTKFTKTDFARASTQPTKDTSKFLEISQSMWLQNGLLTVDLPGTKLGGSVSKDWGFNIADNKISLSETRSISGYQQVSSKQAKFQEARGYLMKDITQEPSYGKKILQIKTDSTSIDDSVSSMKSFSSSGTSFSGDKSITTLLKIAPPITNIDTTTFSTPTVKVDSYQAISNLFIPSTDTAKDIIFDTELDLKSKNIQAPSLYIGDSLKTPQDINIIINQDVWRDTQSDQLTKPSLTQPIIQTPVTDIITPVTDIITPIALNPISPINESINLKPGTQPPIIIGIDFGGRKRFESKPVQAYQGQVLVKGKYQKVTDKPYTKRGARDFIARVIDNTISAQGKVTPLKKKVSSKKIKKGDGYYEENQSKFRAFKLFAGQKIPVKNKIIEKKEYRLDKIGEQNKITVAQHMARSSKRAAGLPTRKKKSSSIFRL